MPKYVAWLNDHEVNRYMCTGRLPVADKNVFAPDNEKDLLFMIMCNEFKDDDGKWVTDEMYSSYIGTISLHKIDWISRKAEVGYMIGDKDYWGRGIATDVVGLITDYGFNRLNMHKITAGVVAGNEGSIKVLTKNGYTHYATEPDDHFLEGRYFDTERFYKLQESHNV